MSLAVPDTLEEVLTPVWLTAALRTRFPGIEVTSVTPGPVISRVSTNARFRIECAGGLPDGLSPHLCLKGYFSEAGMQSRQVGVSESLFYRELAESTGMRTLRAVYADVDPATDHGVVITEDVVEQGAVFLDPRSEYTVEQTAQSLEELAMLHGSTWGRQQFADVPWLASRLASFTMMRGVAEIRGNFEGPFATVVPDEVRDAQRLYDTYRLLGPLAERATPWCVIHGDAHVGNVMIGGTGRPSFVDWQLVQRGPWYIDVGYHLASALSVEDRRRAEHDLVRHYLDRLKAEGGDPPSWDNAWLGVRRGMLHGFYLWGITLKVDPEIIAVLLQRLGTAAADHDAFGSVP